MSNVLLKIFLGSIFALLVLSAKAEKVDTIQLSNGDILTGEIKRLELGILSYSTDAMSTIDVKWEKIIRIKSPQFFEIWNDHGQRFFGSLGFSEEPGHATLILTNTVTVIKLSRITNIYPIKNTFFSRLEGSADIGYSYTKATRNAQFNLSGHVNYKGVKRTADLAVNSILTRTLDSVSSKKQDVTLSFQRVIQGPWYANAILAAEQNTELGIHLRASIIGGISRDIIRDAYNLWEATAGASLNREWTTEADTAGNNADGFVSMRYKRFKHTSPKMDITVSGSLFPSISNFGRIRAYSDIKARVEVISDLFIGLSFYYSFDNQPLLEEAAEDDWGIVTSLGYSFP